MSQMSRVRTPHGTLNFSIFLCPLLCFSVMVRLVVCFSIAVYPSVPGRLALQAQRRYSTVVVRLLRKQKVQGSIPCGGFCSPPEESLILIGKHLRVRDVPRSRLRSPVVCVSGLSGFCVDPANYGFVDSAGAMQSDETVSPGDTKRRGEYLPA